MPGTATQDPTGSVVPVGEVVVVPLSMSSQAVTPTTSEIPIAAVASHRFKEVIGDGGYWRQRGSVANQWRAGA